MLALRHKAAALALVLAGLLPNVSKADNLLGQPIYAQNNTSRTIWVAARYMPPGGGGYISDGFWRVDPGEKVLILYNGNRRFMYFYARNGQGTVWTGNAARTTIRGETLNMFRADTSDTYDPFTMNFNP
jgi:uncharacterized membrane protein